jgi:hypothetical protein
MSYRNTGKIQSSDINGFLNNNTPNLNRLLGVGTGDSGYGQPEIPGVRTGEKISNVTWKKLIDGITKVAAHQGTSVASMVNTAIPVEPADDTKIRIIANSVDTIIATNLVAINTNRRNAASQTTLPPTTKTINGTWAGGTESVSFTISFDGANVTEKHNRARYFFNCGGQLGVYARHDAGTGYTINKLISEICSNMGTIWLSSPTGTNTVKLSNAVYTGVHKAGGSFGGGSDTATGYGFHSPWVNSDTTVHTQLGSSAYGGGNNTQYSSTSNGKVKVRYNGAGSITVTVSLQTGSTIAVSKGTAITLLVKTGNSNLTESWGVITIS